MVKFIVKLEGLAVFLLATYLYFQISDNLWLYLLLALAPDIAMVAYLRGSYIGSMLYNLFHTYFITILILSWGLVSNMNLILEIGLIWTAHIGMDRLLGFGLKYPTKFYDTHIHHL